MKWKVASATRRQEVFAEARREYEVAVSYVEVERVDFRSPGREKLKKLNVAVKVSASVSCSKLDKVRRAELIFL